MTEDIRSFLTARIAECDESIFNAGEIAAAAQKSLAEATTIAADTTGQRDAMAALLASLPAPEPIPDPEPQPGPEPSPEPGPTPAPTPTPTPPPAQPKPPGAYYDAVAALKDKVIEVQHPSGHMVTQTLVDVDALPAIDKGASIPSGVTVTATECVLTGGFVGDFRMHIGDRQLTLAPGADVGQVFIYGRAPKGKTAGVAIKTGARLRSLRGSVIDGALGVSKALHQEHSGTGPGARIGSVDEIVDTQVINQRGDGLKVAGSAHGRTLIERVLFGQQELGYTGAHYDQITIMAAINGLLVRQCYFDNQIDTDTVGVNNWMQFAPYWDGALFEDIDTEECIMIHENDRSFALAKGSPKPGTWTGKIRFRNLAVKKAGGARKIFYARNNFADEWSGIYDLATGAMI